MNKIIKSSFRFSPQTTNTIRKRKEKRGGSPSFGKSVVSPRIEPEE